MKTKRDTWLEPVAQNSIEAYKEEGRCISMEILSSFIIASNDQRKIVDSTIVFLLTEMLPYYTLVTSIKDRIRIQTVAQHDDRHGRDTESSTYWEAEACIPVTYCQNGQLLTKYGIVSSFSFHAESMVDAMTGRSAIPIPEYRASLLASGPYLEVVSTRDRVGSGEEMILVLLNEIAWLGFCLSQF